MSINSIPKNILFDLGGVLLNIDYNLTSRAFKNIGWENFDDFYSQKNQKELFDNLEIGAIDSIEFVSIIQKTHGHLSKSSIIDAWNAMLLDFPIKRIELLIKLKKNHNIYLLSNTNEIHFEAFTSNLEKEHPTVKLEQLFHKTYYSHLIGKRKPHIETFEYILTDQKILASDTLFIDDSIQHIEGAKKAGLMTHHLQKDEDITDLFLDIIQ